MYLSFHSSRCCSWWLNVTHESALNHHAIKLFKVNGRMWFLRTPPYSLNISALHFSVCFYVLVCTCTCVWVWLLPTHQIAEEKDNSLTWPSCLSLSYAPACVWAGPTASRTTSPHWDKYHMALTYKAPIYPHCPRKHIKVTILADIQTLASAFGSDHLFPALL